VTADEEWQRWLDTTARASEELGAARCITILYEHFACRPGNVHLIVRACQNRKIEAGVENGDALLLFAFVDGLPEADRFTAKIPAAPGRRERIAELAIRFAPVELSKPRHGAARELPDKVALVLVDVLEVSIPPDAAPIHWR